MRKEKGANEKTLELEYNKKQLHWIIIWFDEGDIYLSNKYWKFIHFGVRGRIAKELSWDGV